MTEAKIVVNAEEAMAQFKKMKSEVDEVVMKVESFQRMAARFVEEASDALNLNISKGEEFLAGVQKLAESSEDEKNPLLQALIQLMREDLKWFKGEASRIATIKAHYTEIGQLYA